MNKKMIGALLGTLAIGGMNLAQAGEAPAKEEGAAKAEKKGKKDKGKEGDKAKGGEKSCGADGKSCGGKK